MKRRLNILINIVLIILGVFITCITFIPYFKDVILIFGAYKFYVFPTSVFVFCILFFVKLFLVRKRES